MLTFHLDCDKICSKPESLFKTLSFISREQEILPDSMKEFKYENLKHVTVKKNLKTT